MLRRLREEDPDCFAALRSEPRAPVWEVSGLNWTDTIYCGNTVGATLELVEPEQAAV